MPMAGGQTGSRETSQQSQEFRPDNEAGWVLPQWLSSKESAHSARASGLILSQEDPLEEGMGTHSSILAWKIPWTEELDGLQSMGSQRVG